MAAAAVDVGYLAASYSVPASTLQTLLSEPTVELVQSLLVQIEAKARDYDALKSEKLRSDLELENTIRSSETRQKSLKATADKALKEVEEVRKKLAQQESAREQIESELQNLKSNASSSTTEVQALEARIKTLEGQNRDAIALREAKSAAHDRLAEELSAQHQKLLRLRKQLSELEEKNQVLENSVTSAKYREQNLQREIDTLKKSNDWYEGELNTRTADNTKFRKEKNAQIAELQRANADATQTIESLRRSEATQRQRLEELDQKVEQSLLKIQQLQDEASQKQLSFQAEVDNVRRLAALHQESANTTKAHLEQVKEQLDTVNTEAANELGMLQSENESERARREAAEARIGELELQIEGLESQIAELSNPPPAAPMTPRRGGLKSAFETPGRAGSPSLFSPASARSVSRGGLSVTQLYAENGQLKKEVRALQATESKLRATVEEILKELESHQPELDELRQENERLTTETGSMSELLNEAMREKEQARKEARKAQGDYQGIAREKEIQQQQLRDVSHQLTMLLLYEQIREQGMDALNDEEQELIRRVSTTNEMPEDLISDSTQTGRVISQKLILYKNIHDLQQQNERLIRAARELSEQYEGMGAKEKEKENEQNRQELAKLREQVAQHQEEIKSLELRSRGLATERDMYRRAATTRGAVHTETNGNGLGSSINGGVPGTPPPGNFSQSVQQTPRSGEIAGYEKLIKDLQAHLDALRMETATDLANLKQQADRLAKENTQLQGDKMRLDNALQLANERFELQLNKFSMLQSENNEIKKRCDTLQDLAAKQDVKTQQVAEDLLEAKSLAESLGRENANLKASRDVYQSTETRLQNEVATMMEERTRLNKMISDLQSLRNEQELTESENRRRLQTQAESLEAELQTLKRKLEEEVEDRRRANLVHESELLKARSTVEDLKKAINNLRPELASVKTERDHLQARVDELKVELRILEERSQNQQPHTAAQANGEADNEGMSREEQLSVEIANLKRDLQAAQDEVESAKTDTAKYQAIAKDVEEQIESQLEAHEEYQQEVDRVIAEKDASISDLEKRVEEISAELAATNSELSELRRAQSEESAQFTQRKEQLESEIARLGEEADRYKQTAAFHQEDLKAQAEIATRAQQNYENELVKHSDAMKNLQKEREEHNKLKEEVSQFKVQAEAARTALAENEEHWSETRERYERELTNSQTKLNDLAEQNTLLHQQLENVSAQIAGLKQSRMSVAGGEAEVAGSGNGGLQDVVNYLRKEKEIVDIQYEISLSDNKKLQASIKSIQEQLDHTRELLSAAQQAQAQSQKSAVSLDAYERHVEQLNTLRESNTTLRNDARQAAARLEEKTKELEALQSQLAPLQSRLQELEVDLESTSAELVSARENGEHWQKRCQDVLHKYDRIDPAELEALNEKIDSLQKERDEIQEQLKQASEASQGFEERLASEKDAIIASTKQECEAHAEERRQKLIAQFKERSKMLSGQIRDKDTAIQTLTQERDNALAELSQVKQELESVTRARDEAVANASAAADIEMGEEGQVAEGFSTEERDELEGRVKAAEDRANEEATRAASLQAQFQEREARITELEGQIGELQQSVVDLRAQLIQAQTQVQQSATPAEPAVPADSSQEELQERINTLNASLAQMQEEANQAQERIRHFEKQLSSVAGDSAAGASPEDLEKLKNELATATKEVEDLRTQVELAETSGPPAAVEDADSVSEQVAQQVAAIKEELETQHAERTAAAEEAAQKKAREAEEQAKTRTERMKEKLNEKLKQTRLDSDQAISKLKAEHETELAQLREQIQASANGAADVKTTPILDEQGLITLPKSQVQVIIARNEHAMDIVRKNVRKQMEPLEAKLKEQHAQELEELKQQHAKTVEELNAKATSASPGTSPEDLEKKLEDTRTRVKEEQQKMWAAKMSMEKNRAAKIKAQIEVVEKAAKETPQRPVSEVWEEAKVAKPAPVVQTPAKPQPAAKGSPAPAQPAQPAQPAPVPSSQFPIASTNQPNTPTPNPFAQSPTPSVQQFNQAPFAGQQGAFGRPSTGFQNFGGQPFQQQPQFGQSNAQNPFGMPNQNQQAGFGIPQPGFAAQPQQLQNQPQFSTQPQTSLPQPPQAGRGRGQDNVGTGPAALRSLVGQAGGQQQTGIPVPRGGGIPRASGRGGGRGGRGRGADGIQTNIPAPGQGRGQNSPRTSLNPNAAGFQPGTDGAQGGGRGQKRTRGDDGGDGDGHGPQENKRARGGRGRGRGGGGSAAGGGGDAGGA